jgi:predicted transcriptional regulator
MFHELIENETIENKLLLTLAQCYEHDPAQFVTLPRQTVDSSAAREAVAQLRNEGYVEEEMRGVIRLTPRGYKVCKSRHLAAV